MKQAFIKVVGWFHFSRLAYQSQAKESHWHIECRERKQELYYSLCSGHLRYSSCRSWLTNYKAQHCDFTSLPHNHGFDLFLFCEGIDKYIYICRYFGHPWAFLCVLFGGGGFLGLTCLVLMSSDFCLCLLNCWTNLQSNFIWWCFILVLYTHTHTHSPPPPPPPPHPPPPPPPLCVI